MPRTRSRGKVLAAFNYPLKVEVRAAEFKPLASVALLDVARLSRGNHTVEIGSSDGGCCPQRVFATIRKGMVTAIKVEPCKESRKAASRQVRALVAEAYRRARRNSPKRWKPVRVEKFFASPQVMARFIITWEGWCIQICWGIRCLYCCSYLPECYYADYIWIGPLW